MDLIYDLTGELEKQDIRISHYRLKVLEFLIANRVHPTADMIYVNLLRDAPHLSRTTIYNTLHTLSEAGLVRVITLDSNEARYDIATNDHGHFKCEKCGSVSDFSMRPDATVTDDLTGFKIHEKNVYFKGICPACLSDINLEIQKEDNSCTKKENAR